MAKGTNAKKEVVKILENAFGDDFIAETEVGKKIYVWADDGGGQMVQICIGLTCPKTEIEAPKKTSSKRVIKDDGFDFSGRTEAEPVKSAELSQEDKDTIAMIKAKLNL